MLSRLWISLVLMAVSAAAHAQNRELHALFDAAWEQDLKEDPLQTLYYGDRRYVRDWPDESPAARQRREAADARTLASLQRIDRAALSPQDRLSYDLFAWEYRSRLDAVPFKTWLYDLKPGEGVQALSEQAELLTFDTVADYENWIARLQKIDRYLEQYTQMLETGIREKRTQPKVIMERLPPALAAYVTKTAEENAFYAPFKSIPAGISAADRARLQASGKQVIESVVIPAYSRFEKFFRERYLPACRETVGIWDTPDGEAFYRERVKYHTTTNLSPDEIHEIGLEEVARIRGEMDGIIKRVGFKGNFAEFVTFLRTDPQFYYKSPDDLFRAYVVVAKLIEPELVKLFGKLPRTPYGLRAIPMTSAPNTTTAYYQGAAIDGTRPGYYYVNLYRPEVRPKYEMEVLTVHEAVPGHHLQLSLAQEQSELPAFRRNTGPTAFVEGWALYSEGLGEDLGLYKDPYSKFGQLTYDMWRAVRLVVDTGMHAKKWTRQQAIDYFKANAAKTEADIINEIDRYISWPGQALAYKIGQRRIQELRRLAETTLGPRFDVRAFHDVVLSNGAVPLEVLDAIVREWIQAQQQK
jgi:uncharacterized protein (DUF885 family)